MNVNCDVCARMFEPALVEVTLTDRSVRQSFSCPHCGTVYPVARITRRGVELREQIGATADADLLRDLRAQLREEITDERSRR